MRDFVRADDGEEPPAVSEWAVGAGGRLRDVVALSTLPAIWFNAEPPRIAESLGAALFTTLAPAFVYVCLHGSKDEAPAITAQVGRYETSPSLAEQLGPAVLEWARQHDPDDLLVVRNPLGPGLLRITALPLGIGAELGVVAAGFTDGRPPDAYAHLLLTIAATQAATAVQNMRLLGSLRRSIAEKEESQVNERRAREENETLQEISRTLAAELDLEKLLQRITDAATQMSGAKFGAFFYNVTDGPDEGYSLFALSGARRAAFERFGLPRNTPLFEPTFRGTGVVRLDDVRLDPRYGRNPPHHGMPEGHLPVCSYMAVPVLSRSGEVHGGLFLGHPARAVFTDRSERLVLGIAAQAAIAIDNARLYRQAQEEIAARKRHEARQTMLLQELNHRVKNTLATVQSIAVLTLKGEAAGADEREAFQARLAALSRVHDLLTADHWAGADLRDVVVGPLAPYGDGERDRFAVEGPSVQLKPQAALTLGMAFHELATNAAKYGALSNESGRVRVVWQLEAAARPPRIRLRWTETGGPPVSAPRRRGLGSLLIERALAHNLGGRVQLCYEPGGLVCSMDVPLAAEPAPEPVRQEAESG